MNICPKCRSYNISGPRYSKGDYGQESLTYRCGQCGYEEHAPTADANQRCEQSYEAFDAALQIVRKQGRRPAGLAKEI